MKVLVIEPSRSYCAECGKGADPYEATHETVLSYNPEGDGCGVQWTHVASNYAGLEQAIRGMRPDLTYLEPQAWFDEGTRRYAESIAGP